MHSYCCVSLTDVIDALKHEVDAKWKHFGTFLHFKSAQLDAIDKDKKESTDCMLDLVHMWMSHYDGSGDLPRTWMTVVKAVKSSGYGKLAEELAKEHGVLLT